MTSTAFQIRGVTAYLLVKDGMQKLTHSERAIYGMRTIDAEDEPTESLILAHGFGARKFKLEWFKIGRDIFLTQGGAAEAVSILNKQEEQARDPS